MVAEFKFEDFLTEEEKLVMNAVAKGKLSTIQGDAKKILAYAKNKKMDNIHKFGRVEK